MAAVAGGWWLLPLVPLVIWSFTDRWHSPDVLPSEWGLESWRAAVDQGVVPALGRSFGLAVVVAAVATPLGATAARGLALHAPRHGRLVAGLLLLPVAIPPVTLGIGFSTAVLRLHVPATLGVVLVLVTLALPYSTFVLYAAYSSYQTEFEESARTLGASPWSVHTRVHLPLVAPALATAALLAFLVAWSDYVVTVLVGGGRLVTAPMLVASLASGSGTEPVVAAAAVASVLPPMVLLVGTLWLVRGGRWR